MAEFRFHYDGTWTRWFKDYEDFSLVRDFAIDKVEVIEEVTREEFNKQFPLHAIN